MNSKKYVRLICAWGRLFAASLLLAVAFLTFGGRAWADQPPSAVQGAAASPVTVRMGDVVLKIPQVYLARPPGHDGPHPDGLNFAFILLLPDLEPKTPINAHEFERPGWNRNILISVYYKGLSAIGKELFEIMMDDATRNEKYKDRVGPFVVVRQIYSTDDELWFTNMGGANVYFARCSVDHVFFGNEEVPTNPSCKRTVLISKDTYVDYYFSKSFIGSYAEIERKIIALLNSFRTNGQPFEVIE